MSKPAANNVHVPEWLSLVPDDGFVNARDMACIFGYKTTAGLREASRKGFVPKPDAMVRGMSTTQLCMWKVTTVKAALIARGFVLAKTCAKIKPGKSSEASRLFNKGHFCDCKDHANLVKHDAVYDSPTSEKN